MRGRFSQVPINNDLRVSAEFKVLMAASMNTAIFWIAALCILVDVQRRFRGTVCPNDGGSKFP